MIIHIGSDHAGYDLKEVLKQYLIERSFKVLDHGAHEMQPNDDYVDFVVPVAQAVASGDKMVRGIVLGGSGQGEAIVANRFWGVRAIVFNGQFTPDDGRDVPREIKLSREHNNSNVLSLGARFLNQKEAIDAVAEWLDTPFSEDERHVRRLDKLDALGGVAPQEASDTQSSMHT
jgi:ribose 5-phosphate isomerase B